MSANGKGDPQIAVFTDLELEGGNTPTKLEEFMTFLEANLEGDKLVQAKALLGLEADMTNQQLYAKLSALYAKKKDDDEYEYPEAVKKAQENRQAFMKKCMEAGKSLEDCAAEWKEKQPKEAEIYLASYSDFVGKCRKAGKSMAECAAAWKKKHPEPSKKEAEAVELALNKADEAAKLAAKKKNDDEDELPEEVKKKMDQMNTRVQGLETELKELRDASKVAAVEAEVKTLVNEKHLSPKQAPVVMKLSAAMGETERAQLFDFFRTTQTFAVGEDVGRLKSGPPGVRATEIDEEYRKQLIKNFNLGGLIEDKADKTVTDAWWRKGDN